MKKHKYIISVIVILAILIVDQLIKINVKTSMYLGERYFITDWFQLVFVENNGMAFGWDFGAKTLLTTFRILAVGVIAWFIIKEIHSGAKSGYVICLSMILAGAAGNIIDCLFYGMVFNDPSAPFIAEYMGWGNGYSHILTGKVVDMFYFPLIEWNMPNWMPLYRGEHCVFFSPIFNFADAAISCGVIMLLLFYSKSLNHGFKSCGNQ